MPTEQEIDAVAKKLGDKLNPLNTTYNRELVKEYLAVKEAYDELEKARVSAEWFVNCAKPSVPAPTWEDDIKILEREILGQVDSAVFKVGRITSKGQSDYDWGKVIGVGLARRALIEAHEPPPQSPF